MRSFKGMSLIDVVVGTALVLIVFSGIFGLLKASLEVSGLAKLKAAATAIAGSQMEYIRSLAYEEVGTVGGIPAGLIPQNATTTNAGIEYEVRTYIVYVDDPADGVGGADTTGITTDYKLAKVVVTYEAGEQEREIVVLSNIAPKGIETTTGGGTLRISVVDALGTPVSGATVEIQNPSTAPSINFSTFSDVTGTVFLPGAPTSTDYRIHVSKTGYSSAETYARDATNANPTPGYLTVVGGSTTSGTFAIDALASLILRTFSPIAPFIETNPMDSADGFSLLSNAAVSGGALLLSGSPGSYAAAGSATQDAFAPEYLAQWTNASASLVAPLGTEARFSIADGAGVLLSEGVLPGNALGFTGTIDLTGIATTTYPALSLVASLSSSDPNMTPQVLSWEFGYDAGPIPLPDIDVELTGAKTIGSTAGGASLYKTEIASTTGASALYQDMLEWDLYTLAIPGFDIVSESLESPYELLPSASVDVSLVITPQ